MTGQKNQRSKYFLAIVIPAPAFEEVENIKNELFQEHGLKGALRSPAHITLHRPFEWSENKENNLLEAFENFPHPSTFLIELCGFSFFQPRVIFVNVNPDPALNALHTNLTLFAKAKLNLHNEADDMRGFHPHVTVAFRDLKKQKFYELQPLFEKRAFQNTFPYTGFSILKLAKKWEILKTYSPVPSG